MIYSLGRLIRVLLTAVLLILLSCPAAVAERTMLRVGYTPEEGYLYQDEDGCYSGYAYEYLEFMAPYGNWRLEFVPGSRQECLDRLQQGEIDVIPGIMPKSREAAAVALSDNPMGRMFFMLALRDRENGLQLGRQYRIGATGNIGTTLLEHTYLKRIADVGHITFQDEDYSDADMLHRDYQAGRLDGYIVSTNGSLDEDKLLGTLGTLDSYLAVRLGNTELLQKLNEANRRVNINNPNLQQALFDKYYMQDKRIPLLLNEDEKEYLRQKKKLVVLSSPGQEPYSYFIAGQHKGIIAEILQQVSADLGIGIEVRETPSNDAMMELLAAGKADLVSDFFTDCNWAALHHVDLTVPYLELNYVAVRRRLGSLPENPRVACVSGHYYTHMFVEKMYPQEQRVYYATTDECLQAVSRGEADLTYLKAVTAQQNIWKGNYYDLLTDGHVVFSHPVSMGVNENIDPILLRILNKEINHLDKKGIQGIINRNLYNSQDERNIISWVYLYPFRFLAAVALIAVLIISGLLYIMRMRREHASRMQQMAYHDPVTGIRNMNWFMDRLPVLLREHADERAAGRLFIEVFGVARFDVLAEIYGSDFITAIIRREVNEALQDNSQLLAAALLQGSSVCCLMVQRPGVSLEDQVRESVAKYTVLCMDTMAIHIDLKAGVARVPQSGNYSLQHVVGAANIACTEIFGTNRSVCIYDEQMHQKHATEKQIEELMEKALQHKEFQIWCQPKYDIRTKKLTGGEALVRWQSPELGFLMPGKFIDIFEHNGFIINFDYYMLTGICALQRRRLDNGQPIVPISVNQSRLHMDEENYIKRMQQVMDSYGLPAGAIELELTETAFVESDYKDGRRHGLQVIRSLQEMGFAVSMDDFGTGYSSLALLQQIPMDVMKIDRSLLLEAEIDARAQVILQHIIHMAQNLQMKMICEGIETPEQEELLLRLGCGQGQGYLYAKPMPLADFEQFMEQHC